MKSPFSQYQKNKLIASELNFFENVCMRVHDFRKEVLTFVNLGSAFSRDALKIVKLGSRMTECFGHCRRIMFLPQGVSEDGFQKDCKLQ